MTHAQRTQTDAGMLMPALIAGLVMAATLGAAVTLTSLPSFTIDAPPSRVTTDQAVLESGQQWEHQHRVLMGNGVNRATLEDGIRWEGQRRAQSGSASGATDDSFVQNDLSGGIGPR